MAQDQSLLEVVVVVLDTVVEVTVSVDVAEINYQKALVLYGWISLYHVLAQQIRSDLLVDVEADCVVVVVAKEGINSLLSLPRQSTQARLQDTYRSGSQLTEW